MIGRSRQRQFIWPAVAAAIHGLLTYFFSPYGFVMGALPASAWVIVTGWFTGDQPQAEYFVGRLADVLPYAIAVECALILIAGWWLLWRRDR